MMKSLSRACLHWNLKPENSDIMNSENSEHALEWPMTSSTQLDRQTLKSDIKVRLFRHYIAQSNEGETQKIFVPPMCSTANQHPHQDTLSALSERHLEWQTANHLHP